MSKILGISCSLLLLITFLVLPPFSLANTYKVKKVVQPSTQPSPSTSPSPSSSPSAELMSSFELFWPMAAGRTDGDSLYFLKLIKEKIRGLFIFGTAQKADYEVFLGAKRMLETEKLIEEGKNDLVNKTLDRALVQFSSAQDNLKKAQDKRENVDSVKTNIKNRISNVDKLVTQLEMTSSGDVKSKLSQVKDRVGQFLKIL